jgi:ceramide glucosyltransferase
VLSALLAIPILCGSVYSLLCLWSVLSLRRSRRPAPLADWPPASVLKPVHGLERGLEDNLRSACLQDYPRFQVVFSVQESDDPALPLLRRLQAEFGPERVSLALDATQTAPNGKIRNLLGAIPHARHEVLVISDSDVRLQPGYLRSIVAPLGEPGVGCVCTLYKAVGARRWFERMEQLTLNADFIPNVAFAHVTGASSFCLGASTALTRSTLQEIGGFEGLSDYLVEDYEMGRRILALGKRIAIVPDYVETMVDLKTPAQWWSHQVYWDQNTRAANPWGLFATVLVRAVPFALLLACVRRFDPLGLAALAGALLVRLLTAAGILARGLGEREGLRSLPLLPLRDLGGLVSWALAFGQRTVVWRGKEFLLTRHGRMLPRQPAA